jgi:hypothetical protein
VGYEDVNNAVRLQLFALAYNLANFLRTLPFPMRRGIGRSRRPGRTSSKTGAKVVRHGRYLTFQLAEVAVPRGLSEKILGLIAGLRPLAHPT